MKNKEKITIAEELNKMTVKEPSGLVWLGYTFLAHLPFVFGPKYHVKYKVIDDINNLIEGRM